MKDSNSKKQSLKHMLRVSLVRMLVVVDMTLMYMHMEVLVLISVERNQLLSSLSKVSQVDQDSSHHFQLMLVFMVVQLLSLMSRQLLCAQLS